MIILKMCFARGKLDMNMDMDMDMAGRLTLSSGPFPRETLVEKGCGGEKVMIPSDIIQCMLILYITEIAN